MTVVPLRPRDIQPDTAAAVDFLRRWDMRGPWVLTAIVPDGPTETKTFGPGREREMIAWIDACQNRRNIYFSVNSPKTELSTKAKKADIGWFNAIHVDIDVANDDEREANLTRALESLQQYEPPPTVIVNSGGGYQGFWLLQVAGKVTVSDIERLESYNRQIEQSLGGDHCHNIDRIMRLPGTVNLPNQKKRESGRVPILATVAEADWTRTYSLADFTPAAAPEPSSISGPMAQRGEGPSTLSTRPRGASRSDAAFRLGLSLRRAGKNFGEMCDAMLAETGEIADWLREKEAQNRREDHLRKIWDAAGQYLENPEIMAVNEEYAVVLAGGKACVLKEHGTTFELMSVGSFNNWLANKMYRYQNAEGKTVSIPLAKYWIAHPLRRQFQRIVFAPGQSDESVYNLWNGFAIEPREGDCSLFLDHVKENICQRSDTLYQWVIGWCADIVQHPDRKIGTSLAIRGKQGTGKTIFGKIIGSLFGDHYVSVADPRYITGRFNSHLISCLLLHADEGFWAGDHAAEGKLKDLVTGEDHHIELKGIEAFKVKNYVRLLVTGNPRWIVPAGLEERRFPVLDIGDAHREDHQYFAAIQSQMDNGGREALLYYLLHFDTTSVNLRSIPKTDALLEQKISSMSAEQLWWFGILSNGRLPPQKSGRRLIGKQFLFDHYINQSRQIGVSRRSSEIMVGRFLNKTVPDLQTKRRVWFIVRDRDEEGDGRGGAGFEGDAYLFPDLSKCRGAFQDMVNQDIDWDELEDWQE
jgi:hypothetical protein